jgi:hypothetical protein
MHYHFYQHTKGLSGATASGAPHLALTNSSMVLAT